MGNFFRRRFGIGVMVISLTTFAVLSAFYLGKFYIDIMQQGGPTGSTRVMSNQSKSVVTQDEGKLLTLNPVPVYFLQVGVYSDMGGAEAAAKPLTDLGYRPYITERAPHKIWLGVYKNREDTEIVKKKLLEKGFSSFTGAVVVNGENLRYRKGSEALIKEITPLLETYTLWLKEILEIYNADSVEKLNGDVVNKQMTVVENVYKTISSNSRFRTGSNVINMRFGHIEDIARLQKQGLDAFKNKATSERYNLLQYQMLKFVDNYILLLQEIDKLSQT